MKSSQEIDVSILIVSFNTRELTTACLDSLVLQTRTARYETIVVDNASHDGSADAIARHASSPRLIGLKRNIGFAAANNRAAGEACGRYLLLLNPDTIVCDRAVDRLVAFARANPAAGIWGGRTLFADGSLNPASCWSRMTPWNLFCRAAGLTGLFKGSELFNGEAFGGWRRDTARQVDIVSGCFLLIERELWQRLGGFDPLFFMYGEEADLCLRAGVLGARPLVTPDATIIHYGGASERVRADKMVRLLAAKASLIERHWHGPRRHLGLALHALWPLTRAVAWQAMAIVDRGEVAQRSAQSWREVWRRRAEWRSGYADVATGSASGRQTAATAPG